MTELDQSVGEMGNDPFRTPIKTGRDSLVERGDLGDLHKAPSIGVDVSIACRALHQDAAAFARVLLADGCCTEVTMGGQEGAQACGG